MSEGDVRGAVEILRRKIETIDAHGFEWIAVGATDLRTTLNALSALTADLEAAQRERDGLKDALELCLHKINQRLEGQYPEGQGLRAARDYGADVLGYDVDARERHVPRRAARA